MPWVNINTSLEELDAMKISRDYIHGAYTLAQKQQWTRQREAAMFKKVQENKGKATKYLGCLRIRTHGAAGGNAS
jgi:hypothetical protein